MTDEMILCRAMEKANEAFEKYLSKEDRDAAFFSLYLTGYILTSDFEKLKEIKMNLNATGKDEFQYPDRSDDARHNNV